MIEFLIQENLEFRRQIEELQTTLMIRYKELLVQRSSQQKEFLQKTRKLGKVTPSEWKQNNITKPPSSTRKKDLEQVHGILRKISRGLHSVLVQLSEKLKNQQNLVLDLTAENRILQEEIKILRHQTSIHKKPSPVYPPISITLNESVKTDENFDIPANIPDHKWSTRESLLSFSR